MEELFLKQVNSIEENSGICIYGCGKRAEIITNLIEKTRPDVNIICYLDSNKDGTFRNKNVYKIDDFIKLGIKYDFIFIASAFYKEIAKTLECYKIKNYIKEEEVEFIRNGIEKYIRQPVCPICKSNEVEEISIERHIKKCKNCSHSYVEYMPALEEVIEKSYSKIEYWYQDRVHQNISFIKKSNQWDDFIETRMKVLNHFKLLDNLDKETSKIFEIGCSEGIILRHLIDNGYNAFGCEVNKEIVETSVLELGVPIINNSVENLSLKDKCLDVIISFHTFEHLINPLKILEKCHKLLKTNGKILIQIPIDDGEFGNTDHLHFFTTESCLKMMEQYFKNIEYYIDSYKTINNDILKSINIYGVVNK